MTGQRPAPGRPDRFDPVVAFARSGRHRTLTIKA